MLKNFSKRFFCSALFLGNIFLGVNAYQPVNRHLPFWSEVPHDGIKDRIDASAFFAHSSQTYDKLDRSPRVYNPFGGVRIDIKELQRAHDTYNQSLGKPTKDFFTGDLARYKNFGSIKMDTFQSTDTRSVNLAYFRKWDDFFDSKIESMRSLDKSRPFIKGTQFFVSLDLPIFSVSRSTEYVPSFEIRNRLRAEEKASIIASSEAEEEKLSMLVHDFAREIGADFGWWDKSGIGDLSAYAGFSRHFDYTLRCRSIDLAAAFGLSFPTASAADRNNVQSFSFGHGGVAAHLNLMAKVELRRGWHAGAAFEWTSSATSNKKQAHGVGWRANSFQSIV